MLEDVKKELTSIKVLVTLLIIAVGFYVLQTAWSILSNFTDIFFVLVFAWLLSFALEPVVDRISKITNLTRIWSALITYILLAVIITIGVYFYIPAVKTQVTQIVQLLPGRLNGLPPSVVHGITSFTSSVNYLVNYLPSLAQFAFSALTTLILSFYFLSDKENINKEFYSLMPKKWHTNMHFIQHTISTTFSSFIRIQLIFGVISAVTTLIVMLLFGAGFATFSALLAGIFAIIPLIGPFLALIPPVLAAFVIDPTKAIIIGLVLLALQQVEFNIIGPKLMGSAFKLHPAVVLLSFLVGLKIGGSLGAIFAVPVLGILVILFQKFSYYFIETDGKNKAS